MPSKTIEAKNIRKSFGPIQALGGVTIALEPGKILAVLGENGAGKSTLVSILTGSLVPDFGQLIVQNKPVRFRSATEARAAGIAHVHQHFSLIGAFTVEENIRLGALPTEDPRTHLRQTLEIAARLGWETNPKARVADLSVGQQQRVEIVRALATGSLAVLFDEPTATLTPNEAKQLFELMRSLKSEGRSILLITHKLQEVFDIADSVLVLRGGHVALEETPTSECTPQSLAHAMVGEFRQPERQPDREENAELVVENLVIRGDRGNQAVRGASLRAKFGSILGIAGVDGNGQVELAEALAGIRSIESGEVTVYNRSGRLKIAYIPQDRVRDGLAINLSVADNLMIKGHTNRKLRWGPFIRNSLAREWRLRLIQSSEIKCESESIPVWSLSGGNQQKIILSRSLDETPDVVVAVDPSRGLDLRAASLVRSRLIECAARGCCVLLFSADLEELQSTAHRIGVMSKGEIKFGDDLALLLGGVA